MASSNVVPITVAHGDGIGPEIMAASLRIMKEAGARIEEETIEIGGKVYLRGISAGARKCSLKPRSPRPRAAVSSL